ncbi:MAG TPA: P-II family nitrogen regulator [Pirellulales bacterium]|jgi:nitrogen regulatory protein P-II 1
MYKIEAIIRPDRFDLVKEALSTEGFSEFVAADVYGYGSGAGPTGRYRGVAFQNPYLHQIRVELCVPDSALDVTLERIVGAAFTGVPGDGKIFVSTIAEVIEIGATSCTAFMHDTRATHPRLASTADSSFSNVW